MPGRWTGRVGKNGQHAKAGLPFLAAIKRGASATWIADVAAALLIGAAAFLLSGTAAFRALDGIAFDAAMQIDSAQPPKVVIVDINPAAIEPDVLIDSARRAGIRRIGVSDTRLAEGLCEGRSGAVDIVVQRPVRQLSGGLQFTEPMPFPPRSRCVAVPAVDAPGDYGMRRRQYATITGLSGPISSFEGRLAGRTDLQGLYWVRTPARQNIPRITAAQLTDGVFTGQLQGYAALLNVRSDRPPVMVATSLDPGAVRTSEARWRAYAVQTLIDRREVTTASWLAVLLFLVGTALISRRLIANFQVRRFFLVGTAGAVLLLAAGWFAILQLADRLLPLAAAVFALMVAAVAKLLAAERKKDRRLERTIETAVDLAFDRDMLGRSGDLARYFERASKILRLPYARVLERQVGQPEWREIFAVGTRDETTRAIRLDDADRQLRFAYSPPRDASHKAANAILDDAIARFTAARDWQDRLLSGAKGLPVDARLDSAASLIGVHGDELARGLDALDTGVFVFRPLGMPIQANVEMREVLGAAGVDPDDTTLIDTIVATTELDEARAQSMVRAVLLEGSDLRVPMKDYGARQRILRLGIASKVRRRSQTVLVLEAVDITELDRLAELRLAFGTFIDRQLRNDLEAITLGNSLARDPRLAPDALVRVLDRIGDVVKRATDRLDEVRVLLDEEPYAGAEPSYPVEARKIVAQAFERAQQHADELGVQIVSTLPAISGFSIAEPLMLSDMIEAILRIVIADTAQEGEVVLSLDESERTTTVRITGGFGLPFDRFVNALDARSGDVPAEYQIAAAGIAEAIKWGGSVTYWSAPGDGFRFSIQLRRV